MWTPFAIRTWYGRGLTAVVCVLALSGSVNVRAGERASHLSIRPEWYYSDQYKVRRLEGKPAPEFNVNAKEWIGEPQTLAKLRGRIVVLDLWAIWCGPCHLALDVDARIARKYSDRGVTLIGVHDSRQGWKNAIKEVKRRQIQYSVVLDSQDVKDNTIARYTLEAWPTYVVIDRKGIVRAAGLNPNHVEQVIDVLLREPDDSATDRPSPLPDEVYNGGRTRCTQLRAMEGTPLPSLLVEDWLGTQPDPSLTAGGMTVVNFLRPTNAYSRIELDKLAKLNRELTQRGHRLIAVCARGEDWAAAAKLAEQHHWDMPIGRDGPTQGDNPTHGATGSAIGIPFWPLTIVVDGEGVIRAAGIRADRTIDVIDALSGAPAVQFDDPASE